MQDIPNRELLRLFVQSASEEAFSELVRRHINLVYSVALRHTENAHDAQEITQAVFIILARKAAMLGPKTVLSGWLYHTARLTGANFRRAEVRHVHRKQEAYVQSTLEESPPDALWCELVPLLDEAMAHLDATDRDAVVLRYFEKQDLRAVGGALGVSEDAAQKRVSRAVERLREFFAKRGVTVGASGLVVAISANAVQAAPVGMAVTISTLAALAGTSAAATATAAATRTVTMTTLQKTIIGAALAIAVGTGIYEGGRMMQLRDRLQTLQQQQAPLREHIQRLQRERDQATGGLAALREETARLNRNSAELLRLRGEVGALRRQIADAGNGQTPSGQAPLSTAREYYERASRHSQNHEYEAQLADLTKAIELDPTFAEAFSDRAALYAINLPMKHGGYEKAVADYSRYLELKSNDCSARHNQALYYEQLRQYDNAIVNYTTLIEGDTDFSRIGDGKNKQLALEYHYRGRAYHWYKRDYSKAIADYTSALQLDPQIEGAHQHRGQCYEFLGQPDKARQDFAAEKRN